MVAEGAQDEADIRVGSGDTEELQQGGEEDSATVGSQGGGAPQSYQHFCGEICMGDLAIPIARCSCCARNFLGVLIIRAKSFDATWFKARVRVALCANLYGMLIVSGHRHGLHRKAYLHARGSLVMRSSDCDAWCAQVTVFCCWLGF